MLRDVTRQLADTFHKLVMVVDTSEEIAGGGDVPHTWIGTARRCWAPLVTASKKCWRKRLQTMDQRCSFVAACTAKHLSGLCVVYSIPDSAMLTCFNLFANVHLLHAYLWILSGLASVMHVVIFVMHVVLLHLGTAAVSKPLAYNMF